MTSTLAEIYVFTANNKRKCKNLLEKLLYLLKSRENVLKIANCRYWLPLVLYNLK